MPTKPREITDLSGPLLAEIVRRLLAVGVPPTAIANAFEIEPGPIRMVARQVRRETYGTDELSEANTFLTWLAHERLMNLILHGAPEIALKAAMQVQAKSMAITARQTPEEVSIARGELAALTEHLEITDAELEEEASHYEEIRPQFVPAGDDEA